MDRRVLVLADEANLMAAARTLGRKMDWGTVRKIFTGNAGRILVEFILYVGLPPDTVGFRVQRANKLRFIAWCRRSGFLVVTKEGYASGETQYKANVDVLMAIDGTQLAYDMHPDVVVLCTGDGDFAHLALTLRRRGIRVEVAAPARNLAAALQEVANTTLDLTELFTSFEPLDPATARAPETRSNPTPHEPACLESTEQ